MMTGSVVHGLVVDRSMMDRLVMDGFVVDGLMVNRSMVDGLMMNRLMVCRFVVNRFVGSWCIGFRIKEIEHSFMSEVRIVYWFYMRNFIFLKFVKMCFKSFNFLLKESDVFKKSLLVVFINRPIVFLAAIVARMRAIVIIFLGMLITKWIVVCIKSIVNV